MKYSTSTRAKNYITREAYLFIFFFKESPLFSMTHLGTEDTTSVSQDMDRELLETMHTLDMGERAS